MKKMYLVTVFLLLFFLNNLRAQVVVEGININELENVQLCQVVARGKLFSNKVTITIDYGQEIKWASEKGSQVLEKEGRRKKFNSVIAALNYMENNGWSYLDANVISIDTGLGTQNVYHYYFRKNKG